MSGGESNDDNSQRVQPIGTPRIVGPPEFVLPPFARTGEAEYNQCLRPKAALARFPYAEHRAITQLHRELGVDRIQAIAHQALWRDRQEVGDERYVIVPPWVWRGLQKDGGEDFWDTGYLLTLFPKGAMRSFEAEVDRYAEFFDVRFWPDGLPPSEAGVADAAMPIRDTSSDKPKGGRPSGKYGEPIALVTMRLLRLEPEQLAKYTAASLAHELIAEFARLKLAPPSLDNAERDAAGILRAVRN